MVPRDPWLYPEEQKAIITRLYEFGLIKVDNNRRLPLKSGGLTDIYINLRDARSNPEALKYLASVFTIPIQRLGVDRFVEVPDAVSCFAGPLSIATGVPYLTIRKKAKEGRVSDARFIGNPVTGERVCIIDDVITDGASKVAPHKQCVLRGLDNRAVVVLVDRQNGWQKTFADNKMSVPLWAGMTLHDVRRHLIQELDVMERCKKEDENENKIIVALDGQSWGSVFPVLDKLRTTGCILKVNDLVFNEGIRNLLPHLSVYGRVMVDLKLHDIPNTVLNTCNKHLRQHSPWAVTVHTSGGGEMIKAAKRGLTSSCTTQVLAVTVLTSVDPETCEEVYHCQPMEQVLNLAKVAAKAGADGFVCSPLEVKALRELYPNMTIVTPGVRSDNKDADDQKRVATPREAIDAGADYVVMGRQILGASDPVAEVERVLYGEIGV